MDFPSLDFYDFMQILLMIILSGIGIGVRALHRELLSLRDELHRYVLVETCRSRTEGIEGRISRLEELERSLVEGKRRYEEKAELLGRMEDDGK